MPLYDYKCADCGSVREILQRSSDQQSVECQSCDGQMQRQRSAPRFRLKGSGWYETDFKSKNKRNLVESGADSTAAASDSKPADSGGTAGGGKAGDGKAGDGKSTSGTAKTESKDSAGKGSQATAG